METLELNRILKDTSGVDIDGVTATVTSEPISIPGKRGFAIHLTGTSAALVDVQLSPTPLDATSWVSARTSDADPTVPYGSEVNETNYPYCRVVITTGVAVTARICVVDA